MIPPSLPPEVLARSFRARNGELGVREADVDAFLDACDADGFAVLGWELWLVDHEPGAANFFPSPSPGSWTPFVPVAGRSVTTIFSGHDDARASRAEIREFAWPELIAESWLPLLRFNFTVSASPNEPGSGASSA